MKRLLGFLVPVALLALTAQQAGAVCLGGAPDGRVAPTEDCDDGNTTAGDGCTATCLIEDEYTCARQVSFANLDIENFPGSTAAWTIAAGNLSGLQTVNTARPTVALFGEDAMRGTYAVRMEVETDNDDDFIGLALGFNPGDQTNPNADYLVVDWKQAPQDGVGPGLRVAHVRGVPTAVDHIGHGIPQRLCASPTTSCATQLTVGRQFGTVGWADNTPYTLYVTYRADRLELVVNGVLELRLRPGDFPGQFVGNAFPAGQLGFYLLSQERVRYTNLAPAGPSRCNLTSLSPATIDVLTGTPSVQVDTASLLTDVGDALAPSSVAVTAISGRGTATVAANGAITFTPTDPTAVATYVLAIYACDDDPVIPDCDTTTVTINYYPDHDGDGVDDRDDLDDDNDGIPDAVEGDVDTDGDGVPDRLDLDSDDDGLPDVAEAGHGQPDADGDGLIDCAGGFGRNGLCDAVETAPDSGAGATPPVDTDGDGVPDFRDLDSDDDGIGDRLENGTACADAPSNGVCDGDDRDRDGSPSSADGRDGYGVGGYPPPPDTDGDGVPDYRDLDSDGDGLPDVVEAGGGAADTDDDGRVDGPDRDGDGLRDAVDDSDGDGVADADDPDAPEFGGARPQVDTDGDGVPDARDLDADDDGLPDVDEAGPDVHHPMDSDGDGVPDFQDPDSDNDMIGDAVDNCRFAPNPDQRDQGGDGLGDVCDPDDNDDGFDDALGVSGGGCAIGADGGTSSPGGAVALLLIMGAMMCGRRGRHRRQRGGPLLAASLACGAVLGLGVSAARAQVSTQYSAERFELTGHRDGILGVEWADVRGHLTVDVGLWFGYANDPVNLYQMSDGERVGSLVANRIGGDLVAAIHLKDRLELGLAAPVIVAQSQELGGLMQVPAGDLSGFGLGDLRLTPKLTVLRGGRTPFAVAVLMGLTLPTSTSDDYGGDDGVTVSPALALSRGGASGLRLAAVVGYRARPKARALDLTVDDEAFGQLGAAYRLASSFELDGTFDFATGADDLFGAFNRNHAEVRGGAAYDVTRRVRMFGALGAGLAEGFGTPDWRALVGLRLSTREAAAREVPAAPRLVDSDGDGLLDPDDQCVAEPETRNGYLDLDGCPDEPDPDGDHLLGDADACPTQPEDVDGFQDGDGCPDADNDQDGVADADDACRDVPGLLAMRGCPDPDRDGDRVVDRLDNCPDEPGAVDNQGCVAEQRVKIVEGKLEILDIVYFSLNRAQLARRSFSLLDEVARVLIAHPEIAKVRVEGHTDSQGDDGYNKDLSQRRASAVRDYLIGKGVAAPRLEAMGFGEEQPKADNATREGRAINRRVEFTLLGGDGVEVRPTGPDGETTEPTLP